MKLSTTTRKKFRVSNKLKKVAPNGRFRLSISRSAKNISAQIIDDKKNITLLSSSSIEKEVKSGQKVNKTELSKIVEKNLLKKLKKRKLQRSFLIEVYINIMEGLRFLQKHLEKTGWNFSYGK